MMETNKKILNSNNTWYFYVFLSFFLLKLIATMVSWKKIWNIIKQSLYYIIILVDYLDNKNILTFYSIQIMWRSTTIKYAFNVDR